MRLVPAGFLLLTVSPSHPTVRCASPGSVQQASLQKLSRNTEDEKHMQIIVNPMFTPRVSDLQLSPVRRQQSWWQAFPGVAAGNPQHSGVGRRACVVDFCEDEAMKLLRVFTKPFTRHYLINKSRPHPCTQTKLRQTGSQDSPCDLENAQISQKAASSAREMFAFNLDTAFDFACTGLQNPRQI